MSHNTIEKMTSRHYKILDFYLAGLTTSQIADQLKMSPAQVTLVTKSPSFCHQAAMRRHNYEVMQDEHTVDKLDEVKAALAGNAKAAADKLIGGLDSASEKIQLKSAVEILDRTGYPKEQKLSGQEPITQVIINTIDLKILQESAIMANSSLQTEEKSECEAETVSGSGL